MATQPEFSYFVNCESLKDADKIFDIEADEVERDALARRFDLLSLETLKARAIVSRGAGDLINLTCEMSADITQECTVSSKTLKNNINCRFERSFSPTAEVHFGSEKEPEGEGEYTSPGTEEEIPEPPDPLVNGGFDLGETVAEQLSLEIDPFPRSPEANFDGFSTPEREGDDEGKSNPFAVLEQLKKKS